MADVLDDDYIDDGTLAFGDDNPYDLDDSSGTQESVDPSQAGPSNAKKRKRRRELDKIRKAKKRKVAEEIVSGGVPHASFAAQSPAVLAKYVASVQAKAWEGATALELADLAIPDSCFEDTSSFIDERSLVNLPAFVDTIPVLRTRLGQKSKTNGAPTLLYIVAAALRGTDVVRALKPLRTDKSGQIAKLFAKHFKLEEHISYLRKSKIVAGVATPNRLGKLLEADCLSLDALSHIIVDFSFQDTKKRNVFDIPETRQELFKSIFANEALKRALQSGKIKLVLF